MATQESSSEKGNDGSFEIFHIEKNNETIRRKVLKNIIKMLTERKVLNKQNLKANIEAVLKIDSDDYTYVLDADKPENNIPKIAIKITHQKIAAVSKQSVISEFLQKYKMQYKIVVVQSINAKSLEYIVNNHPNTEIFKIDEMMIDLIKLKIMSRYKRIPQNSEDYKKVIDDYNLKKREIPRIFLNDHGAKYYNLKKGDLVRVKRPSETAGESIGYRLVI